MQTKPLSYDPSSYHVEKLKKWIRDLKIKPKTFRRKHRGNLYNLRLDRDFVGHKKAQTTKSKKLMKWTSC